jgi:hypothetical protein
MKRANMDRCCGLILACVLSSGCGAPPEALTEDESGVGTAQQPLLEVNWHRVDGAGHDIGASAAGAWVLGTAPYSGGFRAYRWIQPSSAWEASNIGGDRIAVERLTGRPWIVNNVNQIWHLPADSTTGTWVRYPGCARDIGAGDPGVVWFIGCDRISGTNDYAIYKVNGMNAPIRSNGGAVKISVAAYDGLPWVVNSAGRVYRRTSPYPEPSRGGWQSMSANGRAYDIAANCSNCFPADAWIIGRVSANGGFRIEYLPSPGESWVRLPKGAGFWIAGASNRLWHTNSFQQIYQATLY